MIQYTTNSTSQIPTPQTSPITLHDQTTIVPYITALAIVIEDSYSHMDHFKQRMKQMRVFKGIISQDVFDDMLVAPLSTKFKIPDIERYIDIGCPCII